MNVWQRYLVQLLSSGTRSCCRGAWHSDNRVHCQPGFVVLVCCRLAAQLDVVGVIIGSIVGHAACTGAAVLGGKHLAEHIDEKIVGVSGLHLFSSVVG